MIVLTPIQQERLARALAHVENDSRVSLDVQRKPGKQIGTLILEAPATGQRWEIGPGRGAR